MGDVRGLCGLDYEVWECASVDEYELYATSSTVDGLTPYLTDPSAAVIVCERYEQREHDPADPATWTREQLVAELRARMGLQAPEGWRRAANVWRFGEVNGSGPAAIVQTFAGGSWSAGEGVTFRREVAPTLTGPGGAFARAEKAAGVTHDDD